MTFPNRWQVSWPGGTGPESVSGWAKTARASGRLIGKAITGGRRPPRQSATIDVTWRAQRTRQCVAVRQLWAEGSADPTAYRITDQQLGLLHSAPSAYSPRVGETRAVHGSTSLDRTLASTELRNVSNRNAGRELSS
jgi:hypothetical protein